MRKWKLLGWCSKLCLLVYASFFSIIPIIRGGNDQKVGESRHHTKKKLTIIGGILLSTVVAFVIGIAVAVGTVIGIAFASEIFSVSSSA